jgi:hypothetical protein
MFMWKRGIADSFDHLESLVAGVDEVGFKTVERFEADLATAFLGVFAKCFQMLHHGRPLLLVFVRWHGIRATHGGIDGTNQRRTTQHHHLVEKRDHVSESGLLRLGVATQIAIRPHARTDRPAHEPVAIQFAFHMRRINVRWVFNRDLDGIKAPLLELWKQFRAGVVERRREQECVDAKFHDGLC